MNDQPDLPKKRGEARSLRLLALVVGIPVLIALAVFFISANGKDLSWLGNFSAQVSPFKLEVSPETLNTPVKSDKSEVITVILKDPSGNTMHNSAITYELKGPGEILSLDPLEFTARYLYDPPAEPGQATLTVSYGVLKKEVAIKIFDPTPPAAPTITSPTTDTHLTSAQLTVSGNGPANLKVKIKSGNEEVGSGQIDKEGRFVVILSKLLKNGAHDIYAVSENELGIESARSGSIRVSISANGPTLDTNNIVIRPSRVAAGGNFDVFVPASTDARKVFVIYNNSQYELRDTNKTSVFSGRVTAPGTPNTYPISFSVADEAGNTVLYSNIKNLLVQ